MTAPTTVALPFHRLAREPRLRKRRYAGWKPAAELFIALGLFILIQVVYFFAYLAIGRHNGIETAWLLGLFKPDAETSPAQMLLTYGAIASTGLGALLSAWFMGRKSGALWSVAGKIRWKIIRIAAAVLVLPLAACYLLDLWVYGTLPAQIDRDFWLSMLILVALIPLQCTAEELVFRGSVPQAFGAWIRSPFIAYALAIPFFVLGHTYDLQGLAVVAVFATLASVLVHRTGGLEASIVLHSTNNMNVAYTEFSGLGDLASTGERDEFMIAAILIQYVGTLLLLILLRRYAPARGSASAHVAALPGWYPGAGWLRDWPATQASRRARITPHPSTAPRRRPPGAP